VIFTICFIFSVIPHTVYAGSTGRPVCVHDAHRGAERKVGGAMTDDDTDRTRALSRRHLLQTTVGVGAVAGLGGLAGCTGGDGSGDGGGSDGNDGSDSGGGESDGSDGGGGSGGDDGSGDGGGAFDCTDLTSGYETYDSGEVAFVFDMDLPETVIDNAEYDSEFYQVKAKREAASGEKLAGVFVTMSVSGYESPPKPALEQTRTLSFNGEDRPVYALSSETQVSRTVHLPYDIDGETNYFMTDIIVGNDLVEMSDECEPVFDEVARSVVMSLTLNEATTIESEAF
jgi:hypothetical protein